MRHTNPKSKILAEAKRARASITFTTKCLGCGDVFSHKHAWFKKQKMACPACGGALDLKPFLETAKTALKRKIADIKTLQRAFNVR